MADLIEKEKALRTFQGTVAIRVLRHLKSAAATLVALALAYVSYAAAGMHAAAQTGGSLTGMNVNAPVRIYRDARDIPHIRADDYGDAYFAEGFAQASDRLFQMDLFRRYIYGRLSEVLGPIQLPTDQAMRAFDVHDIVDREWGALAPLDRRALLAFSDGVNAAMRTQPLPVEFRLLLYKPDTWTPRDSLAVTLAISASLGDTAENVVRRDVLWRSLTHAQFAQLLPLSDAAYDVPPSGKAKPHPSRLPALALNVRNRPELPAFGSNAWAAGAWKTTTGRALLANDPHLSLGIPGVWYAVELHAPGLHVAGVTIPGVPGVVLGHNERVAWASTNAVATTLSVFRGSRLNDAFWRREVFHVRFSRDRVTYYYRTPREFAQDTSQGRILVRWAPYYEARTALTTVFGLDRAANVRDALRVLRRYAGPPQNFLIADTSGQVAYHLAGSIPNDPAWGRYVHDAAETAKAFGVLPFGRLPFSVASRGAVLLSANNKMYGKSYPYRLTAMFAPPYRAYRIAQLLHKRSRYDAAYFARMQLDVTSPADAEFAHRVARFLSPGAGELLAHWDGAFLPQSRAATLDHLLRSAAGSFSVSPYTAFDLARRPGTSEQYVQILRSAARDEALKPWGLAGEVDVFHPFGPIGFPFLNGARFPGNGDEYTIRMQTPALSQSFRAVWDVGAWENGGLSLPTGESGEKGSGHYDDLSGAWVRGELQPLPFSDRAVRSAAMNCLLLEQ